MHGDTAYVGKVTPVSLLWKFHWQLPNPKGRIILPKRPDEPGLCLVALMSGVFIRMA